MTEEKKAETHDSNTESPPVLSPSEISYLLEYAKKLREVFMNPSGSLLTNIGDSVETYKTEKISYFAEALSRIASIHAKKADDYTDSGEFDNFIESAQAAGIDPIQAIENLIGTKEARIRTTRRKTLAGKDVSNEPLIDSYLDRAVYSIIAYAYILMCNDYNHAGNPTNYDVETKDVGAVLRTRR